MKNFATYIRISRDDVCGYWLETRTGGPVDCQVGPSEGYVKIGRRWVPKGYKTREEAAAAVAARSSRWTA